MIDQVSYQCSDIGQNLNHEVVIELAENCHIKLERDTNVVNPILCPITEGGQIYLNFVTVQLSPYNLTARAVMICWSGNTIQGACHCLPPPTVLEHVAVLRP